jgi:hypothetical protein
MLQNNASPKGSKWDFLHVFFFFTVDVGSKCRCRSDRGCLSWLFRLPNLSWFDRFPSLGWLVRLPCLSRSDWPAPGPRDRPSGRCPAAGATHQRGGTFMSTPSPPVLASRLLQNWAEITVHSDDSVKVPCDKKGQTLTVCYVGADLCVSDEGY